MEQASWIWIDERVVPSSEARVPVLDRGFLYGDSVFEVTRTVDKRPIFLLEHLDRLEQSASLIGFAIPDRAKIEQAIRETVAAVAAAECYIRVIVTRGSGPLDLDPATAENPRLLIIAKPLELPSAKAYAEGIALVAVSERRNAPGHVSAQVKSSNFLSSVLALRSAKERGGDEGLMCDLAGFVTEGASSNIFLLDRGRLRTPPLSVGILPGITRAVVLELGRTELVVDETPFRLAEVFTADEAFLTSSIRGILPVATLDGLPIGAGHPGPHTLKLMDRYAERLREGPEKKQ